MEEREVEVAPVPTFRVAAAEIRRRNMNLIVGGVLGTIFCVLVYMGHLQQSEKYNAVLLLSVLAFFGLFAVIHVTGHVRYVLKIRRHVLEVHDDGIWFRTGDEESRLDLQDVAIAQPQKRWREGPSLMMKLKNNRVIRLVGYEEVERLTELVLARIAALKEASDSQSVGG
ncbi:MAG: hypothetical protein HQL53_13075 [Magnetococcales bacterium]|nr:hypothetical protein [Magnetococcales bacterium]